MQGPSCGSCNAVLRYPRSSFGTGNISLCVIFLRLVDFVSQPVLMLFRQCSLWSRFRSQEDRCNGLDANLFLPDGTEPYLMGSFGQGGNITYGRISIQVSPEGIATHKYSQDLVEVTEEEVLINVTFVSTFGSAITFYAVHQTKIEPYESDVTTTLIPMPPSAERNKTGFTTALVSKPLDFTCTELDLSAIATGIQSRSNVHLPRPQSFAGTRGTLTAISLGGMDHSCSIMHSEYPQRHDVFNPYAFSFNYYRLGLYRQFTNSSNFRDFSARSGSASLIRSPGFHLVCVAASVADAAHVKHNGAISLRYRQIGTRNSKTCSSPFAGSYNATAA